MFLTCLNQAVSCSFCSASSSLVFFRGAKSVTTVAVAQSGCTTILYAGCAAHQLMNARNFRNEFPAAVAREALSLLSQADTTSSVISCSDRASSPASGPGLVSLLPRLGSRP
jgi:hypothetical protein